MKFVLLEVGYKPSFNDITGQHGPAIVDELISIASKYSCKVEHLCILRDLIKDIRSDIPEELKEEKLTTIQGMWNDFYAFLKPCFTSKSQLFTPSTSNASLRKTKCTDNEGFIHPSKTFKPIKLTHIIPKLSTEN